MYSYFVFDVVASVLQGQMMTKLHGNAFRVIEMGRSSVDSLHKGPVMQGNADLWCLFDVSPNKLFNKHPIGQWSEMSWRLSDEKNRNDIYIIHRWWLVI